MKINKYGLQWTVKIPTDFMNPIVLQQGGGLVFVGYPAVSLFWGPYLAVESVSGINKHIYDLPNAQWFFAPELEDICIKYDMLEEIRWYHTLHNGFAFSKSAFKRSKDYWCMSLTSAIKEPIIESYYVADLFDTIGFVPENPKLYIKYSKRYPFLYIDNDLYNSLPAKWTIHDIYNINKDYYDNIKKHHEQLWYNIAEAKQSGQPIVIFVEEEYLSIGSIRCIYTEQKTPYGMTLPIIIPYKEGREYI